MLHGILENMEGKAKAAELDLAKENSDKTLRESNRRDIAFPVLRLLMKTRLPSKLRNT